MILTLRVPGWISWILRLSIAAIFIYAGITKVITPLRFITDVNNFHLLPWVMTVGLAFYLPWLEIFCGVALLLLPLRRGALLILLTFTLAFVFALASARIRGIDINCGCFGHATQNLSFATHIALDFGILAVLAWLWQESCPRLRT
jgi:putative oxidoreductase